MNNTMAVQVRYNSWYIFQFTVLYKTITLNDQILRCLENANHDG